MATPSLTVTQCTGVTVDHLRVVDAQGVGVVVGQSTNVTVSRVRVEGETRTISGTRL